MKKELMMLLATIATFAAFADSYTWTGGGADATSWNDENNWDPAGVPGGGDTATFTSAATIADGIVVSSGELKIYANAAAVTINGVISGEGSMYYQLPNDSVSKIVLSGANTYSGGTTVDAYNSDTGKNPQTYGVWLQNATAFGSNRAVAHKGGTLNFNCANAVFAYDFTPSTRSVRYNAHAAITIDGFIASETFASEMNFCDKVAGAKLTVTGKVGGSTTSHINIRSRSASDNRGLVFEGGVVTQYNIRPDTGGDGWSAGCTRLGAPTRAAVLACAYNWYVMLDDDALDENVLIDFTGYCDGDKGINLNGTRQTVNRIQSQYTASSSNCRQIYSTAAATLIVRPSRSSLANMSAINGAVNLILDAQDSSYVQQFSNRVSTTTGTLTASNGILRIGANASFANTPKLAAAGNGAIEVTSAKANALAGVREIVIEGNGRISLPAAALTAKAVAVTIAETASLEITDGLTLEVASLKIGNTTYAPNSYPAGTFTQITGAAVSVPVVVSPDSTGVWTGGGATEVSIDPANWQGGYPGGIPITFATGGTRALLGESLDAAELKFDTPAGTPTFTVAVSDNAPDSKVILSGNIVMTNAAHASGHTNVVSAPLAFTGTSASIKVDGAANGLALNGPIVQQGASLALTRTGSGTLWLNATNSARTAGNTYLYGGTTYLTGGALGGTATSPVYVESRIDPSSVDAVATYFTGGTYNQNFQFIKTGPKTHNARFAAGSTNIVNGYVRAMSNYSFGFNFDGNSHTTINGGFYEDYVYGYALQGTLYRGAVLEIRNKPLYTRQNSLLNTRIYAYSTGGTGDYAKMVFAATGNISTNGLYIGGPMRVVFETDFAFDKNSAGQATPIGLMQVPTTVNNDYLRSTVMDLNGHSQRFGSLQTPTAGSDPSGWNGYWGHSEYSYFTSATPATLYVYQYGRTNAVARPWKATFRGAMSFVKEGPKPLTLAGNSTMTGRLEVAEGRLDFSGSGAMTNITEFAVSGGVLAIDRKNRLSRDAVCHLSGGKVDIAAGVSQRVRALYVPDGADGWTAMPPGMYSASNLPEYISGGGTLRVGGGGMIIMLH